MILTAVPHMRLQFGDMLNLVGEEAAIEQAAKVLGNSVRQLNETSFASIFVGITVGIFFGLYPWESSRRAGAAAPRFCRRTAHHRHSDGPHGKDRPAGANV